jgi:uncharacterized protein YndB with AHSA1/START domain
LDTRTSIATKAATGELVISRVFDAPRGVVFKAWTDPEHLARWWGPQGFATISCVMDVRPGGAWCRSMRSPDGREHRKRGVYREVVEPERLVFTYATEGVDGEPGHQTLVTVTFADFGGKTKLTLHQAVFESVAARDSHEGGWTSCLEGFASYLANVV